MASAALARPAATAQPRERGAVAALARSTWQSGRGRTIAFACGFAVFAYIQPVGYRSAYATLGARLHFAASFAGNDALRLFYGYPFDPVTVAGYSAWRVGGTLALVAAVFGVLAAVRALRTEEDSGRMELVLAGEITRGGAFWGAMTGVGACLILLWLAETVGFVAGGLQLSGSAYQSLANVSVAGALAGIGALASQFAATRRVALELGFAAVALFLALRVIADTASGVAWLRWLTPLGWAEQMRPFTGARPAFIAPAVLLSVASAVAAQRIAARRDVGAGVLGGRDSAEAHLRLLSSPLTQALRAERPSLIGWAIGIGAFGLIVGDTISAVSTSGFSKNIREAITRLGVGSIATKGGYLGFVFTFFILAVSVFACAQIAAARQEEADEHLETLLALPIGRARWLGGRLVLAAAAGAALAALAALATWGGAAAAGSPVSLAQMLEASANCLPAAILFLGAGALAYAVVPRASGAIAYSLVSLSFVWYLVGSMFSLPGWIVGVTPFAHIGLVPAAPFRVDAALAMSAVGIAACACALALFRGRDLTGPDAAVNY